MYSVETSDQILIVPTQILDQVDELAYHVSPDGQPLQWNDRVSEVTGYSHEELAESTVTEHFESDERTVISDAITAVVTEKQDVVVEADILTKTGDRIPYEFSGTAVTDDAGDVVGIVGIGRDISERKAGDHELRTLTQEYEGLLENTQDGIFLLDVEQSGADTEFRFIRLSPSHEFQTGFATEEIRGKSLHEVLDDDFGAEVESNYRRCVEMRKPITYQEKLSLDRSTRVWQTNLTPVIVDGEVTQLIGIARNVTEQIEQEQQLLHQNERLKQFASLISHDLRNPLNVAQLRTEFLQKEDESSHLLAVTEALERMEVIIEDTLLLARQGETIGNTESITLTDIVTRSWNMVEGSDATMEILDDVILNGDPDRLQHLFENLFQNAIEHGGENVTVRVGGSDRGIYVEDDGPGIDEELRDAIFEPGHSSASGGIGFGLTIVKRIVEAHGWEIRIMNGDDGGARFEITGIETTSE